MFGKAPKLTLAQVRGIPIRLDATFIFVPIVLFMIFNARYQEAAWPAAALCTVGVFLSILLHEAGHAAVARMQQVGVAQIVVGGFFGFATLKHQATPRKFLIRILAAGPLTSLAIFLLLWLGLVLAGSGLGQPAYVTVEADWLVETLRILAFINLAMFIFNGFPVFPLDGGRILGLALDRKLSPRTSLRIVSILSAVAGVAMIVVGLGISLFLSFIGVMIVMTNLRRLRSKPSVRAGI